MNELHLFAGCGGGILGGLLLGHTTVCAVEISEYRRKVLLQRQRDGILPRFPIWDDVTTFDGKPWRGRVDVVAGGFPCRGISSAGKMLGLDDPQSALWKDQFRVVREVGPKCVFVENSPNLTLLGLHRVLSDLASLGYNARWCVLGGADAGMDTDGARIWILAQTAEQGREGVLLNHEAVRVKAMEPPNQTSDADTSDIIARVRKHELRCGEPAILGKPDGLANRVDRLAAIGDGQIPAVVALAWRTLLSRFSSCDSKDQ